jgi:hypothetical protein
MVNFTSFQRERLQSTLQLITPLLNDITYGDAVQQANMSKEVVNNLRSALLDLRGNIRSFFYESSRWSDDDEVRRIIANASIVLERIHSKINIGSMVHTTVRTIVNQLDGFLGLGFFVAGANNSASAAVRTQPRPLESHHEIFIRAGGISNIVPPAPAAAGPGLPASSAEGSLIGVLPDPSPAIPQSRRRRRSSSPASYRDVIAFVSVDDDDVQVVGGAVGMAGGFTREEHDQADLMLTLFLASPAFEAFVNRQIGYIQGGAPQDSRENLIANLQIMRNIFLDTHRRQYTDRVVNLALDTTLDANNLWENFQEILLHATRQTRPRLTGIHPSLRNDGLGDGGSGDGSGGSGGASGGSGGRWVGGGD